ncbi:MAG: FKBP-type peptidyl-prolyl cis-trans isomerase [Gemmatimonadetes bacterium]|nr:FKBP-type peptidyl-prolyl cis-trans isomerase [Gemmatimonadota bacterium]
MRLLIAVATLVAAGACAGASQVPPIASSSISPSLGVDLAEYTRTTDGLYYKEVRVGTGAEAMASSRVTVAYRLLLANGTQVDSSTGLPIRLARDPIIKGWKLGIPGMRVGGSRILIIPPELGYGWQKVGLVPANSTLLFNVQLLKVE